MFYGLTLVKMLCNLGALSVYSILREEYFVNEVSMMKNNVVSVFLVLVLGFGFWSLSTQPANGEILCLVGCQNQQADCNANAIANCRKWGSGMAFTLCLWLERDSCKAGYRKCVRDCGPCPI